MKKLFSITCFVLAYGFSIASDVTAVTFVTEDGVEISAADEAYFEAYLLYCATATASTVDSDGNTFSATGSCCSTMSEVANICASNRADFNLQVQLLNYQ